MLNLFENKKRSLTIRGGAIVEKYRTDAMSINFIPNYTSKYAVFKKLNYSADDCK